MVIQQGHMSVKKAILRLEVMIENKQRSKAIMLAPEKPWNRDEDSVKRFANAIAENLQNDIEWLQSIKIHLLPEQQLTKMVCRHPKKDHDVDGNGQKYCTGCNANL